jgi:hypothetical protein
VVSDGVFVPRLPCATWDGLSHGTGGGPACHGAGERADDEVDDAGADSQHLQEGHRWYSKTLAETIPFPTH